MKVKVQQMIGKKSIGTKKSQKAGTIKFLALYPDQTVGVHMAWAADHTDLDIIQPGATVDITFGEMVFL